MILHIKINGSYLNFPCTMNQVRRLEDTIMMGNRFIRLGDKNYNIAMIEYWWADEEELEKRKPPEINRPKGVIL